MCYSSSHLLYKRSTTKPYKQLYTRSSSNNTFTMDDYYCCDKKCFRPPSCQFDGMACKKCESYSYCTCRCKSFKPVTPKPVFLKVYKTRRLYTCCTDMCSKFHIPELTNYCRKCYDKDFCECKLKLCKNRKDWES